MQKIIEIKTHLLIF